MSEIFEQALEVLESYGVPRTIDVAIVLGTGMGSGAETSPTAITIPFSEIPGFPTTTVAGHEGQLIYAEVDGSKVLYLQGRTHFYETGDPAGMASALATLAALSVNALLLTCAAGSVRADIYPGTLALITDHINFSGRNPLIGMDTGGAFVNLVEAYDQRLLRRIRRASATTGVTMSEGVYMWFSGPSFETPAEIKMARTLGADLVGMSVVPEVILARRLGLRVCAVAVVTNYGAGFSGGNPSHSETQSMALSGTVALRRLMRAFVKTKEDGWR
jgi:purine-nucleoside phosphorylase